MTESWVINASPLILLGKAGQLGWLLQLGLVIVPQAVAAEIAAGTLADPARQWLDSAAGAAAIRPDVPVREELLAWDLGPGETGVIAWAMAHVGHEAVL